MTLRAKFEQAIGALKLSEEDAATVELARTYAELMDNAAPAAKYVEALRWLEGVDSEDANADRHVRTITAALSAHTVASDLGPKFQAALDALGMTPRARSALKKGGMADVPARSQLDQLAERRAGKSRTTDLDAIAP